MDSGADTERGGAIWVVVGLAYSGYYRAVSHTVSQMFDYDRLSLLSVFCPYCPRPGKEGQSWTYMF